MQNGVALNVMVFSLKNHTKGSEKTMDWKKLMCRIFGHVWPPQRQMVASTMMWGMIQEQGNEKPVTIRCRRCKEVLTVIA
jgi:hypothetical protein